MYQQITAQIDTWMPDHHINEPPKLPGDIQPYEHYNKHMDRCTDILMAIQTYEQMYGEPDKPNNLVKACPVRQNAPKTTPKCKLFILFIATFQLLKELKKYLRTSGPCWE